MPKSNHPLEPYARRNKLRILTPPLPNVKRDEEGVPVEECSYYLNSFGWMGVCLFLFGITLFCLILFGYDNFQTVRDYVAMLFLMALGSLTMSGFILIEGGAAGKTVIGMEDWRAWYWKYGPGSRKTYQYFPPNTSNKETVCERCDYCGAGERCEHCGAPRT